MATISTCIIVKNEVNNISKLVEDLRKFSDEIIIVDTGSDDGTYEWLLKNQDDILKVEYFKWIKHFSAARNYSFSKATKEWVFWCDADDRISDKLINDLIDIKPKLDDTAYNAYYINYQFGKNTYVPRLRLLRLKDKPYWTGACHEYVYIDDINYSYDTFADDSLIIHQHEQGHPSRNLPIFINTILRSDEITGRDMYYYSNELRDNGYIDKAIEVAKIAIFMEDMCLFDCWNAMIYTLNDYWRSSVQTAEEGIHLINEFKNTMPMRGDVYYLLAILYDIIGDSENYISNCRMALQTEVDDIFTYAESNEYSKIFPAIDIYNTTNDENEKNNMLDHLKKYKDNKYVKEFMENVVKKL